MGARAEENPSPVPAAQELEKAVKYRTREKAGIDVLAGAAQLMQDYVDKEEDKKKKNKAKKIATDLNTMATKLWSDYQAATKKMQDKAKEIRRL